jgi:hypothetical protein
MMVVKEPPKPNLILNKLMNKMKDKIEDAATDILLHVRWGKTFLKEVIEKANKVVPVRNRKLKFKIYYKCFIAEDLVLWL